ncbi:MAG: agmatine/peptidylarginine deiminase [Arenibacterium sp.]
MASPSELGYHMPPEWAPHARTWMMWPCRSEVWDDIEETRADYTRVAHAIRNYEPVTMVVHPRDRSGAAAALGADIELLEHPIDDSWARDAGPCFLQNASGDLAGASFRFNAWGEKYHPYDGDSSVSVAILKAVDARVFSSDLVAEGGGISVDGRGTVLTTQSCFPNPNRNPDWTEAEIGRELERMLGVNKTIWLPGNVEETETDGHVDGVAVFAAPGVVLIQDPGQPGGFWHEIHSANVATMQDQVDATGTPMNLIPVPAASSHVSGAEEFCDSYVNAYICIGAVIVPRYGCPEDEIAEGILSDVFAGRRIEMVDIGTIALGGGGFHCITQQQPS